MNLKQLLHDHRIRVQGVVEVGAHIGEDIPPFIELGASKIVAIEPNPDIFPALHETAAAINKAAPGRCAVMQAAVAHQPGRAVLHVANEPQSSSLLPMTGHKELYPDIKEVKDIEVDVVTLDGIREDLAGCNILKMDIQGAELHALQGATEFLKQIDAIVIEVGYRMPLYAEAPLVEQIDAFLKDHEFTRVHSETPYSPYWGDALYTRNFIASTTIGRTGGLGNQIFQYMFLKVAHVETGRRVLTAP